MRAVTVLALCLGAAFVCAFAYVVICSRLWGPPLRSNFVPIRLHCSSEPATRHFSALRRRSSFGRDFAHNANRAFVWILWNDSHPRRRTARLQILRLEDLC